MPLNILLADDDPDDRFFFERALMELSVATILKTVPDGQRLMEYLYNNADSLPDILFLDNNMPRKTGSECLKEIKADEKLKHIPVILCSTSRGYDFENTFYENGAHYYIHKSGFDELSRCILKIINLLAEDPRQPARNKFMMNLEKI